MRLEKKTRNFVLVLGAMLFLGVPLMAQTDDSTDQPQQSETEQAQAQNRQGPCDQDGDGVCDECGRPAGSGREDAQGQQTRKGAGQGPADGSGNQGERPKDGTGYGKKRGDGQDGATGQGQGRRGRGRGARGGGRG